jgi:hypothetical protein
MGNKIRSFPVLLPKGMDKENGCLFWCFFGSFKESDPLQNKLFFYFLGCKKKYDGEGWNAFDHFEETLVNISL